MKIYIKLITTTNNNFKYIKYKLCSIIIKNIILNLFKFDSQRLDYTLD